MTAQPIRCGVIGFGLAARIFHSAVIDATEGLDAGTRVTLVGYVNNSMSGAEPPYSCVELAH